MKRVFFVLLDLLSVAFLAGGYMLYYFAKRKLGMVRWLNFHAMKARETMPIEALKYVAVFAVLLLAALLFGSYLRRRARLGRLSAVVMAVMLLFALLYLWATLFVTAEVTPAYFLILPLVGLSALMQLICGAIAVSYNKSDV